MTHMIPPAVPEGREAVGRWTAPAWSEVTETIDGTCQHTRMVGAVEGHAVRIAAADYVDRTGSDLIVSRATATVAFAGERWTPNEARRLAALLTRAADLVDHE